MDLLTQHIVVALIVGACSAWALWSLLPAAARRVVALQALRLRLPSMLAAPLRRAAQPVNACGCDGCDRAAPKPADSIAPQRVTFHPHQRR